MARLKPCPSTGRGARASGSESVDVVVDFSFAGGFSRGNGLDSSIPNFFDWRVAPITVGGVTPLGFQAETKRTEGTPSYFDLKQ
jgi:hypothetical protein